MMTGGCAYGLYLHGNGGLSEKELSEVPTLAVMSPEKYRELMGGEPEKREAGKAIEVQGPGFLDPVNGWGGRFDFHPLYAYQQPDGKIDCDVSFAQSSPQNADYWLVIRTDNGLSLSDNMWIPEMLPSGILAIFTFTLFPVIDNSEVSMPYTVYAAESPEEINSEGAVSMKYVAVQHYLEHFNHITPDARRQVASSKKAICALLRKAVKDAEDNYSFSRVLVAAGIGLPGLTCAGEIGVFTGTLGPVRVVSEDGAIEAVYRGKPSVRCVPAWRLISPAMRARSMV